jgi:hypothetical protein
MLVRPSAWAFAMPASLAFLLLFYVLPLGPWVIRPLAGTILPNLTVTKGATVILLALFAAIWALPCVIFPKQEESALREELPDRWWFAIQRRTGIVGWDGAGMVMCGLGALVCLVLGGLYFIPAFVAAGCGLTGARLTGSSIPWALRHGRRRIEPPAPVTEPMPVDSQEKTFAWSYRRLNGETLSFRVCVNLSSSSVAALMASNPFSDGTAATTPLAAVAARLVNEGASFEIRQLGRQFIDLAIQHEFSVYEEVDNALSFVQRVIEYKTDEETKGKEYWRWPLETLADEVGDCDCKSILAGALFKAIFLLTPEAEQREVVLLLSDKERHMALAVEAPEGLPVGYLRLDGRSYFYCESTAAGMRVGEVPPGLDVSSFTVLKLGPEGNRAALD